MRVLFFEQITDDRFDENICNLLEERVKKIKELLSMDGVDVRTDEIREVDFGTSKQYRCRFYVTKTTSKVTWNDIYRAVNSVHAVPYSFK